MADRTVIEAVLQATGVGAFRSEIDRAGDSLEGLEKKSDKLKRVGKNIEGIGDSVAGFGGKMTAMVTTPIVGGMMAAVKSTEEYREVIGKLEQNAVDAGADVETMQGHLQRMAGISEDTEASVEGLSNLLVAGFKDGGMDTIIGELEGASIRFSETLKFEGLADGLQETLATGKAIGPFAELLERLGEDIEIFDIGLQEAAKSGDAHNYVLETLSKHGLSDTAQGFRDSNKNLVESREATARFMDALAELGETLTPIITAVTDVVSEVMEAFNALDDDAKKAILVVAGIAGALGPVLLVAGTFIGSIGKIAGAIAFLASPVGLLVGALALAAGAIGYFALTNEGFRDNIVETWESLTGFAKGIGDNIKGIFEGVKIHPEGMTGWIGDFKDAIGGVWNAGNDEYTKSRADPAVLMPDLGFTDGATYTILDFVAKIRDMGDGIADAFGGIKSKITQPIADFKTAITGIWKGDDDNNGPAELLDGIGLGQGFIDAIYGVIEPLKGALDGITGAYTDFITIWKEKGAEIAAAFSEYFATFEPVIAKAKEWFGNVGEAFRAVGDRFVLILEGIKNGFIAFGEFMQPFFEGIATIFRTIGDVFMAVAGAIGGAFKTMGKAIADVFNSAVELAGTVVSKIGEWFESLLEKMQPIFEALGKLFEPFVNAFKFAGEMIGTIVGAIGSFFAGLGQGIADIIGGIIGWFSKMWNAFLESGTFLGNTVKLITSIFGSLGRGVGETFGAIFGTITSWGSKFFEGGKNLMQNIIDGIMSGADGLADSVKGVLKRLRDLLPFSPPKDKSSPLVGLEKNGIMSNIADGINGDSALVDSAMRDALSAPDTDALNVQRDLNISSRDLNSRFEHSIDNTTSNEPMALNLNLGGQVYKAFVQNITDQQDRQVDLELAY